MSYKVLLSQQPDTSGNILLVEPVPRLFNRLKNNYGDDPRFNYENSAINENGVNQTFFRLKKMYL
jgi:hypothetical protein